MTKTEKTKKLVDELYQSKNPGRAEWAEWLHEEHVFVVAEESERLAERFGARKDIAVAAAMLHDVADAVMSRFDPRHERESFKISRNILEKAGFSDDEIEVVVDDVLKFHGCSNGQTPKTLEGKVMATADAVVHIRTSFYERAVGKMREEGTDEGKIKEWALSKIERDFHEKILFEEVKEELNSDYEGVLKYFSETF